MELVPSTSWYDNVRSNVSPQVWDYLRRQCYREAGYICEVCGGKGDKHPVECHEQWEYLCEVTRDDKAPLRSRERFIQRLVKLVSLCPSCHEVKHIGYARTQGREAEAKAHLMKVNGWDIIDAELYLVTMWETWRERSQIEAWDLDLTILKEYGVTPDGSRIIKAGERKSLPKQEPSTGIYVLPPLK